MNVTAIAVPDMNDSYSRVTLGGVQYLIRFTYNSYADRWSFGLFTIQKGPIAVGIRIVPNFPLNLQISNSDFPLGAFIAYSKLDGIGRHDFANGDAVFTFIQGA